ncbi:MAG: tetratricopeptide repeat protein, partial [Acidobacteria bacterium]|nr:tetratricopeptide repeat protein [Acidobacteriota bacterium]
QRTESDLRQAAAHFERAIALDPGYAQAHAALAQTSVLLPYFGAAPPLTAMPRGRSAAERALELDPNSAAARAVLALTLYQFDWDWDAAEREFKRAVELDPNHTPTRQWYAEFLNYSRRFDEARAQLDYAVKLDPLSPTLLGARACPELWEGHFDAAAEIHEKTLAQHPDFPLALYKLGLTHAHAGRYEQAAATYERALPLLGPMFVGPAQAWVQARLGQEEGARALLAQLSREGETRYVPPYKLAIVYAGLKDAEQAFAWLERAVQAHDDRLVFLSVDRHFSALRGDPRFAELLRRLGLPPAKDP